MPRRLPLVLLGGLLLVLSLPALAAAAPVTVDLRIEGKTSTLYQGTVTTDVRTIDVGDGTGVHKCDGTNNGANPTPGPTRGAAFVAAATGPGGFTFSGSWFDSFEDVGFDTIAGQSVAYDPGPPFAFLVEYKNGQSASVGSCQDQIATGDDVLYAYGNGSEQLLKLAGPATVTPGASATLHVTDATTGEPVSGASVNGQTTGPTGTVAFALGAPGPRSFKATKDGAIRSNSVTVCATDGADGACGSPPPCETTGSDGLCGTRDFTSPIASLVGIADREHFARKKGPRHLRVHVAEDPSGLLMVKLRLTRNAGHGLCQYFSGRSERFRRGRLIDGSRCGANRGHWFKVGDDPDVDYLLPKRLPRGRYVLDVNAIDKAYNRDDKRKRGRNRIVFYVG
jgi:hypothetical protein